MALNYNLTEISDFVGKIINVIGVVGGILYLWREWNNKSRIKIYNVKYIESGISVELENLGSSANSIKPIVKITGVLGDQEYEFEGKIDSTDRQIPPNQPKKFTINFDLSLLGLHYITFTLEFTKTKMPKKLRYKDASAIKQPNSLNVICFFIGKNVFRFRRSKYYGMLFKKPE